ncbi:uncharacterized protein LOC128177395 [Crassostrea angulata]|uniref:uncharacterized protein LOC128177395 n=1 Tax=Magallana angulata TaxID=2784310 RepID=UPI0022B0F924|nr:uncharacterized protein LOC128177395 [Crassostrea angulata]
MRHKRYVCKEVQPFLLQKMETIRQTRIEFEKYLLNIDPYKAIKQQAKSLALIEIMLQDAENQSNRVRRQAKKFSHRRFTRQDRMDIESRLEREMEFLQKSVCCCGLALKCLGEKYTNGVKIYKIYNKLISDLQGMGRGQEWLFNEEILKNPNDVIFNVQRMRHRVQRGVTFSERGATHYQFVTSRSNLVQKFYRFLRDEFDVAKYGKER